MVKNDSLFSTHLNYQLNANQTKGDDISVPPEQLASIDLTHCTFKDFSMVIASSKKDGSDSGFMDSIVAAIKPADFSEDKRYNFIDLTEYAKHTAINIGNMTLFVELQKISSYLEAFSTSHDPTKADSSHTVLPFSDYNLFEITEQANTLEELGSCVIGGGVDGAIKITAIFHESSSLEHPIISIRFYSLNNNVYLTNRDIINIDNIYKSNATLMETFAYMSYQDYQNNHFNYSFDQLLFNGKYEIDSLDDMYTKHYDLRKYDEQKN